MRKQTISKNAIQYKNYMIEFHDNKFELTQIVEHEGNIILDNFTDPLNIEIFNDKVHCFCNYFPEENSEKFYDLLDETFKLLNKKRIEILYIKLMHDEIIYIKSKDGDTYLSYFCDNKYKLCKTKAMLPHMFKNTFSTSINFQQIKQEKMKVYENTCIWQVKINKEMSEHLTTYYSYENYLFCIFNEFYVNTYDIKQNKRIKTFVLSINATHIIKMNNNIIATNFKENLKKNYEIIFQIQSTIKFMNNTRNKINDVNFFYF